MKKITSTLIAILILTLSSSQSFAALRAVPTPKTPVGQQNKFSDLFTGAATDTYNIEVPKGTNDLAPSVALTYSSLGARDTNLITGSGWKLNESYIERDVNSTPENLGDDKFKLHLNGSVHDLVFVAAENRYHTKIESFINIQKLTGASNTNGEYWQVITKDGTKYRFGNALQSELVCEGRSYTSKWNLDEITDTHNNHIYFTYTENVGTSYIQKIEYNNDKARTVEFSYITNIYPHSTYVQGCKLSQPVMLSSISVKTGGALVRRYDMSYATASNGQPLVSSISEKGKDGTSALPSTTYTYNPEIKSWQTQSTDWLNNAPVDAHLAMPQVKLVDVNNDGYPDIVKSVVTGGPNSTWYVWKNTGNNSWNPTAETWINNAPIDADLLRNTVLLTDVTGDNLPDIVKSQEMGGGRDTWKVWRNTGTSWNTTEETWLDNAQVDMHIAKVDVKVVDVNGDGLTDIVKSQQNGGNTTILVVRNLGNSWSTNIETWVSNAPMDAHFDKAEVRLTDVNGDGLPDVVKSTENAGSNSWYVWTNTGSSWNSTSETWINNAPIDAHLAQPTVEFADVNGDGLSDIVKVISSGANNTWRVLLNKGNGWSTQYETWLNNAPMDASPAMDEVRVADVNGDGLTDIVKTIQNGGNDTWRVWLNSGVAPLLLSQIRNQNGGTHTFEYAKSTQFDNTGPDDLSDLPFTLWVVKKITAQNGMSGVHATISVTNYSYLGGLYKYQDKEFRGFAEVTITESNNAITKNMFKQDDALKGRMYEQQSNDSQNNPYVKNENVWSSSLANGVYTVKLDQEKISTFDGSTTNPKINQKNYTYDSYGNVTKLSLLGDTSISTDDKFYYSEYTYNATSWIVNTIKHTFIRAADDVTKVSESWLYYDSHAGIDDAPTKGDITKKVDWLNGGTNPQTNFSYDSFGNLISTTDANNRTTTVTYGTTDTTRTYPASTTNAKNQTTLYSYDFANGNLLSQTDPNNFTTTYEYDVFGRVTKEIKPYDTSSKPTTRYQYFVDGNAPEGILVSKIETSGGAFTLDNYTFTDGFGRTIQTRSDAEDTSKHIVANTYYNSRGLVRSQSVPHIDINSTNYVEPLTGIKSTVTTYDPIDRPILIVNTDNTTKSNSYSKWVTTTINENGKQSKTHKNAFDKIMQVEEIDGSSSYLTKYFYNALDGLTRITDSSNNNFDFTYDTLGRKISQVDPDMGTWVYAYDAVGNVISEKDNRNITISKSYDELNRLVGINYPTDTDVSYIFDTGKIGTLHSVTDASGTANYTYDNRLRKIQESRTMGGTTWTTSFTYDSLDRLVSQTNPDGEVITYTFNNQGEINSMSNVLSNVDYNALGKIVKKQFSNSLTTDYTYNTTDFRLNKIKTGAIQDLNYTYDNIGNLTSIANAISNKVQSFGYDNLDRLNSASENSGYSQTFDYNPIGNITKVVSNGNTINYTYGQSAGPHMLTSTSDASAQTGYTGEYFSNKNLTGTPVLTRNDAAINFNWGMGTPDPVVPVDNFSVRWTKTENFAAGTYLFTTSTDDGVRLKIDGETIIDKWVDQGVTAHSATKTLSGGNHTVVMEYYDTIYDAVAELVYQPISGTSTPTPSPTPTPTSGYTGEYFNNMSLSGTPALTRNDNTVDFDWGMASPASGINADNFSARWTKTSNFNSGNYQFSVTADDGVRLKIDGVTVIDKWIDQGPTTYTHTQNLSAGNHTVVMEYYENGVGAVAKLNYQAVVATPTPTYTPTPTPTQVPTSDYLGQYFNNKTLSGSPVLSRNDTTINFDWGSGSPDPIVVADNFSVRWTKNQNFTAGTYEFKTTSDDGVRIKIDGVTVIDKWIDQGPTSYTHVQTLTAGTHSIVMEYYENGYGAVAKLDVTPQNLSTSFTGQYYSNKTLSGSPVMTRTDSEIDFNWGGGSPDPAVPADNFSVRWTGTQNFAAGTYTFSTSSDDGVRLKIDGVTIIDKWIDQGPTTYTSTQNLTAGNHTIVLEYFDSGGGAEVWLGY